MAGTVKSPLNKRQAKKHNVFCGRRNAEWREFETVCRHERVAGDKYNQGHPLAGRVTIIHSYRGEGVTRHVVVTQHHNL